MLREIRALNDSMVQFILKYPYSAFLDNLATPEFASILSAHALEKFGANFGTQPLGTGPFQFVRWETDRQIVIKKFPQYWGAPAQLDKVIYQIIPNLNRKIQTLQDGRLDVISGLSATSVDRLYRASGITVIANRILSTTFLGLNCQTYPFSQVNARRAVASALDKKSLVYSISRGLAAMAKGPLPPLAAYCDTTLTSPQYDPGAAKALLKNSGYTNDAILNLIYFIETDTLRANPMIQGFKAYLEKIGMKVNTMPYYDWQTYKQDILSGKSQLFWGGWKGYTRHPDNFLYPLFHSQSPHNLFKYRNSEVDRLLEEARQTSQVERQREIYRRVQEIILRDCPAVFISYPTAVYAIRNRVKNFKVDPLAIPWLQEVRLE
jgi:peptide/nickel transport system substrate-binding protein